jgi:hypothetical protein
MEEANGKAISSPNISAIIARLKGKLLFKEPLLSAENAIHPLLDSLDLSGDFVLQFNLKLSSSTPEPKKVVKESPKINTKSNGTGRVQELPSKVSRNGESNEGNFDKVRFNLDSDEGIHGDPGDVHTGEHIKEGQEG